MLDLARITSEDVLFDLGCGDGRIVIAAAARGARAVGVDLDPSLVVRCRVNADRAGCTEQVEFLVANFFEVDLRRATVITLYLLSSVNRLLLPKLKALAPGVRVVSHSFEMGDWAPDRTIEVEHKMLYMWTTTGN